MVKIKYEKNPILDRLSILSRTSVFNELEFFITSKKKVYLLWPLEKSPDFNPIPAGHGRNQPIYERHVTESGRNRVN